MSTNKTITNNKSPTSPKLFMLDRYHSLIMRFDGTQVVYLVFESGVSEVIICLIII